MLKTKNLLADFGGIGAGSCVDISTLGSLKSIQAIIDSGTATITIQVSNTGQDNDWLDYAQLTTSQNAPDGMSDSVAWYFMRAKVTSNTGYVTVIVGG